MFEGIDDSDLTGILPFFKSVKVKPGEVLIEEGHDSSLDLYLILHGELEVIRASGSSAGEFVDSGTEDQFIIAKLKSGDAIGELSFIRGDPRSASIKSLTHAHLLALHPDDQVRLEASNPRASIRMMKNMVGYVADRLKQTSSNEVRALHVELGNSIRNSKAHLFFSYVIGLLCIYNLTIHAIIGGSVESGKASLISAGIIALFSLGLVLMIRQSKLPARIFGLTRHNWKPAVKESLIWSFIIIGVMILVKWILIAEVPRYANLPLFDFNPSMQQYMAFNFILYGLHSPVQEFVARGVLQGSLQHFFTGRNVTLRAIVVSNALFSATHVHLLSGLLGVIVFIPGLFWGWLYSRHDNLIGVSISHLLVGWTGLFFLNLESLF
jgi:hypothetical protein